MNIIWHRISIQTLLFQACLPTRQNGVENRDKAYYLIAKMSLYFRLSNESWLRDYLTVKLRFLHSFLLIGYLPFASLDRERPKDDFIDSRETEERARSLPWDTEWHQKHDVIYYASCCILGRGGCSDQRSHNKNWTPGKDRKTGWKENQPCEDSKERWNPDNGVIFQRSLDGSSKNDYFR